MKFIIDTEFIDTPTASELISFAIVRQDGESRYFEFDYPKEELTPWLKENVVPHLTGRVHSTFKKASEEIVAFIGNHRPEFWCYYGAYDYYWFCRLFGGFMKMPQYWPHRFKEFADIQDGVPPIAGVQHNALNDCRAVLAVMKSKRMA